MATEQLFNLTRTTVASGGYTSGSGILNVASTAAYPASPQYHLAILDPTETTVKVILKVTAINSGTQFAVTAEGTDASCLISDHVVGEFWSAEAVTQLKLDVASSTLASGTLAGKPGSPIDGLIYSPTDAPLSLMRIGGVWVPVQSFRFTPPVLTDFTADGSQTATITDTGFGITVTGSGAVGSQYYKAAPGSTPFNVTMGFQGIIGPEDFGTIGMIARSSSAGTFVALKFQHDTSRMNITVQRFNSGGGFNSTTKDIGIAEIFGVNGNLMFFRIRDDGTNRLCQISSDGVNFTTFLSEGRTTFTTANQFGWTISGSTNYGPNARILHWVQG